MISSAALKQLRRLKPALTTVNSERLKVKRLSPKNRAGFTLIELLVVIMIVSVLAAIAAPGWITFTNQRRVTAVNEAVLRALQEAQSQAKKTKLSYSVSFESEPGKTPKIAVHPATSTPKWKDLGTELGINPGQVVLGTNLTGDNQAGATYDYQLDGTDNNKKITFDYFGALQPDPLPILGTKGLIITVAVAKTNGRDPIISTQKCVKVETLLGSQAIGKKTECNLS